MAGRDDDRSKLDIVLQKIQLDEEETGGGIQIGHSPDRHGLTVAEAVSVRSGLAESVMAEKGKDPFAVTLRFDRPH